MKFVKNLFVPTHSNNYRAYLISNKALIVYVVFLVLLNIFFSSSTIARTYALVDVQSIVELHNRERAKYGLGELENNYLLNLSAKEKGEVMLEHNCWSHYCPPGTSPWKFFKESGYSYVYAGENLAEGFSDSESVMQAWMNSKTHRENVLKPEYTEVGVAIIAGDFQGLRNNLIIVVHFGKPRAEQSDSTNRGPNFEQRADVPLVLHPENNSSTSDTTPEIRGRYESEVEIDINQERQGSIIPDGGIFTYEPDRPLDEGNYELQVEDKQNPSRKSAVTNFEVDITSPNLNDEDTSVLGVIREADSVYYELGLNFSEELSDLAVSSSTFLERDIKTENLTGNSWLITIATDSETLVGEQYGDLTIVTEDLAGNQNTEVLPAFYLNDLTTDALSSGFANQSSEPTLLGLLSNSVTNSTDRFLSLNFVQIVAILLIIFLLSLFIIDYMVMSKKEMQHIAKNRTNSHLHIPTLVIMLVLIFIGGFDGSV
jgi:hypothetical protein